MTDGEPADDITVEAVRAEQPPANGPDLPLLVIGVPVLLLMGVHLGLVAYQLGKWTRVPYAVWMVGFYIALLTPLLVGAFATVFVARAVAAGAILLVLLGGLAVGRPGNLELVAPAHLFTISAYLILARPM